MRFSADMQEPTHVIDPDGEVILVLKDANQPFAVWPEEEEEDDTSKTPDLPELEEETDEECPRIRASAKHLTLASPVFKSLLLGGWKESSSFLDKGSTELIVSGWDLEAFLVFLRVIHCRNKEVPREVSLELFAKIAVLVDYYACKDALDFFAGVWFESMEVSIHQHRDLMLWLCIVWVFQKPEEFQKLTALAILDSKTSISGLGLPLPAKLISDLNKRREDYIESVRAAIHTQRCILRENFWACTHPFQCQSMMLGGLEKQIFANGLSNLLFAPFTGFDVRNLFHTISSFQPPQWYDAKPVNTYAGYAPPHTCAPSSRGYDQLKLRTDGITGFNIHYYM